MGNCFNQKQREGKTLHVSIPMKKVVLEGAKLKDYLKDEWMGLRIDSYDINTTNHPSFAQIGKDIDRTFPYEQFFKVAANKVTLQRVLKRIALHYPKMGYTQGINFVAGYFLLDGMAEIQAYKSFAAMLVHPQLMFLGFYQDGFPLVRLYCSLFWSLFKKKSRAFAQKVQSIAIPDQMWVFQWFLCFFIYNFPVQYIQPLFAFILKNKGFVSVRMAVGIMAILQPKFEQTNEQFEQQFVQCIQSLKNYEYCMKTVPIDKILVVAQSIDEKQVEEYLQKKSQNWYEQYFSSSKQERSSIHQAFLNRQQKERREFFGKVQSGFSIITYERKSDSVLIIQNTEEKKAKRYFNLFSSVKQKPVHSFIKQQKRYSLKQDRLNGLVESVYN